jgi:hypothetical protein
MVFFQGWDEEGGAGAGRKSLPRPVGLVIICKLSRSG